MNDNSPSKRPRLWRLQFSLRLLLFAFTAFAIGFPLWYRWPYQETDYVVGTPNDKRITTWQRQWGGGREKHGLYQQIVNGKTIESVTYRNGLRHGPYESPQIRGQFVNDQREGTWTGPDRTMTWHLGHLDGPAEIRLPPVRPATTPPHLWAKAGDKTWSLSQEPRVFKLLFVEGRLVEMNGKRAANRLFDALETGTIDDHTRNELDKTTIIDVVEMPLKDISMYLSDMHTVPIVLDSKLGPAFDLPITASFPGIDLCSALLLLTAPNGLGCDYRYGRIWITTADDCNDWHDPTGVANITPPQESALARVWNEPVGGKFYNTQLADILAKVSLPLAIEIDTREVELTPENSAGFPVTTNYGGFPFRHLLGYLLFKTNCRCRLEGERLVVLRPEEN